MSIRFEGRTIELEPGETVLDGIERCGLSLPAFCRSGVCQACIVQAKGGELPAAAQKGLRESWRRQGLFLACMCRPSGDLSLERQESLPGFASHVEHVERISERVLHVLLRTPAGFRHEAGQFLQLERPADGLMRPYSIASLPGAGSLELHVELLPGGRMSSWLQTALGQPVSVRGPFGDCVYFAEEPERPLLLAGTGTGLAPLLGVVRAALAAGHRAPVHLYHGSPSQEGLYLWGLLRGLLAGAPQLTLVGSVLRGGEDREQEPRCQLRSAPLDEIILGERGRWAEGRVYLCGNPEFVRKLQKQLYLAGVALDRIHADPFVAPGLRA